MKRIYSSILPAAACVLLLTTGCKKLQDFGDTNVNPLGSTTPNTGALLTNAQVALGGISREIRPGLYVQYFSETQYTEASLYAEPKLEFGGSFAGSLNDLQVIINRNSATATSGTTLASGSNANQMATARIVKSYIFWTITDRFGDIPYSESLQGTGNLSPAYDKQEDIYKGLVKELKEAVAQFDGGSQAKGDLFYGGDQAKWKKLANSLRMMIALRTSKVYPSSGAWAATEFAAAAKDPAGFIMSNADNAVLNYPGGGSYDSPWFSTYDGRNDYAFSKTIADILSNMGDTRRQAFGGPGTAFPYGLLRADATGTGVPNPTSYSKVLSQNFRNSSSPSVVVNAAASLLTHAEGIERGWISGDAKASYDAGITASFEQWGVSGAAAVIAGTGNYNSGAGGGTNIGGNAFTSVVGQDAVTTTKLERLHLQKYLAYFPDGLQGWSEWRRSCAPGTPSPRTAAAGMPKLAPSRFAVNSGQGIPRRYVYGTNEVSTNPVALAAAVARLANGNVVYSRVWWDL